MAPGKLYIVPTPIGNLGDMTFRAIAVLKEVDRILAEDTRQTGILCNHFGITVPRMSFNEHNTAERMPKLLTEMAEGARFALVSDAGSPGISDPGAFLVQEAVKRAIPIEALPGASAVTTALSGSGFPTDHFVFEGFLPRKGKKRAQALHRIAQEERTVAIFESPNRLLATLTDLVGSTDGSREALVARELTKIYETWHRGTLFELTQWFSDHPPRGEMVIVLRGSQPKPVSTEYAQQRLEAVLALGLSVKESAKKIAAETGLPSADLYRMALKLRDRE